MARDAAPLLERARTLILKALSRRDYSRRNLFTKLRAKGFSPADIRRALHEATRRGILDDQRSAERCADVLIRIRGFAPARVRRELIRKGIPCDIAREVTAYIGENREREALRRAIERRQHVLPHPSSGNAARRKWIAYLRRMGFRPALIADAMQSLSSSKVC